MKIDNFPLFFHLLKRWTFKNIFWVLIYVIKCTAVQHFMLINSKLWGVFQSEIFNPLFTPSGYYFQISLFNTHLRYIINLRGKFQASRPLLLGCTLSTNHKLPPSFTPLVNECSKISSNSPMWYTESPLLFPKPVSSRVVVTVMTVFPTLFELPY